MRRLEAGERDAHGAELVVDLNTEALRPKDAADPDSCKVRRGKVGGYADYVSAQDVAYLDAAVALLDPRYGYGRAERMKDEGRPFGRSGPGVTLHRGAMRCW